jgi:methyltransferase (TIGR00027 family)
VRKDKPSKTAYKVALGIVTLGAKPGMDRFLPSGIVPATEKLLVASGAAEARIVRWSHTPQMVSVYEAFDWMMPGQFEAFAHRKAFCQGQVKDGIGEGATQILVLGAGYDTMAWRLAPEFPGVNFFEIDHPATARLKARGIEAIGQRDNLYLISQDLGERRLVDVLQNNKSWNQRAKTIIVAEGLVMYLSPEAVRDLFYQCALITGVGSRIAFSYIPTGADGRPDVGPWTGLMLCLMKLIGEPFTWSVRPEELDRFLEELGWKNAPTLAGTADKHGIEFYAVAIKNLHL